MWRSGIEILAAQHSPGLDLITQQVLSDTLFGCMKQFTETSSDPYDRHHYRVWLRDGSFKDVETYDEAQRVWYSNKTRPTTIEVMQPKGRRRAKGF